MYDPLVEVTVKQYWLSCPKCPAKVAVKDRGGPMAISCSRCHSRIYLRIDGDALPDGADLIETPVVDEPIIEERLLPAALAPTILGSPSPLFPHTDEIIEDTLPLKTFLDRKAKVGKKRDKAPDDLIGKEVSLSQKEQKIAQTLLDW